MRIGIMGGTLDPVHNGHIQLALAARTMLNLDRVMLLPAGDPPHKLPPSAKEDRLRMAQLAAAEAEGLFASGMEIERKGTTYTVDTLTQLHSKQPDAEWLYLIGADTLKVLDTWRNFDRVAKLCTFVVCARADEAVSDDHMRKFEQAYGAKFIVLPFNGPDISSTDVRNKAAVGNDIRELVPTLVCNYIRDCGLYICSCPKDEVLRRLRKNLKPSRFEHTLGVAETARRLAPACGVDPVRAEYAALLHDCAKYLPLEEMQQLVREAVPDSDEDEMQTESVLHAPAGCVIAQRDYGVQDASILSAIRKHTLGDENMSPLDALIYTADFIEPNRKPFPGLEAARQLAEIDIYRAMCKCAELTNTHLEAQGKRPHAKSIALLEKYNTNLNQKEE